MSVAGHRLLWRLAKSWRSAKIWQVFKIGDRIYFTLLYYYFFWLKQTTKSSVRPKPKYIIYKTPHYVISSLCWYPGISFECWDHLFARIELFFNENRHLRCHAERPVSGWVKSYFIWREWFCGLRGCSLDWKCRLSRLESSRTKMFNLGWWSTDLNTFFS